MLLATFFDANPPVPPDKVRLSPDTSPVNVAALALNEAFVVPSYTLLVNVTPVMAVMLALLIVLAVLLTNVTL